MSKKSGFRPGTKAPNSGQYQQIGPRGGTPKIASTSLIGCGRATFPGQGSFHRSYLRSYCPPTPHEVELFWIPSSAAASRWLRRCDKGSRLAVVLAQVFRMANL